jgi:hypothetical protein
LDTKINIVINRRDLESMPEEEYEAIEMAQDGNVKLYRLRPMIARFVVDAAGAPLPHSAAMRELGKIPTNEWPDVINKFISAIQGSVIPNENGEP